ncbi:response regulator transcription factor [Isoptericola sp. NEAU-Y5]|uniref:Response regulator transcription factor n=1 Tax=Isoptericola luteus TaxID=2879484 RepID=A0ABS7ZB15_9MICO|nr:response regulator transcription factor [Isoptericola sp. NEAU-Y5]MCA5892233.1 response regulator transcription factor [Isoptericola sp. NEAU-Y5]
MIRVLLVDDQALIRSGIRALLDAEDDVEVVAEGATGREGVALARGLRPDVVLMDVQMPDLDGIGATRQICADDDLAEVRVVVLTNYGLDEYVFDALRAGASGFVVKDTEPADLLQAVRVAVQGDALLSPAITRRLISEFVSRPPDTLAGAGGDLLTPREREVVALVAHGLSNDEIAGRMVLSPLTAKTHVSRAMTKLGVRDRAQLVVFAYESGIVSPLTTLGARAGRRRRRVPGAAARPR